MNGLGLAPTHRVLPGAASRTAGLRLRERIRQGMAAVGISVASLASRTGIAVEALESRLAGGSSFSLEELGVVARALGHAGDHQDG